MGLLDILRPGLLVVIVGTAVGDRSAAAGHYYSGHGNRFWELLNVAGITGGRVLRPADDGRLPEHGVGLTDLVKRRVTSSDSKLDRSDFDVPLFLRKLGEAKPSAVAFNGKTAARAVARYLDQADPPLGPTAWTTAGIATFVLPSSSGSNNDPKRFAPYRTKDDWWRDFGDWLRAGR